MMGAERTQPRKEVVQPRVQSGLVAALRELHKEADSTDVTAFTALTAQKGLRRVSKHAAPTSRKVSRSVLVKLWLATVAPEHGVKRRRKSEALRRQRPATTSR